MDDLERKLRECRTWDQRDALIDAAIDADGIERCYICGKTIEDCDKRAVELGEFLGKDGPVDECEWLASK